MASVAKMKCFMSAPSL